MTADWDREFRDFTPSDDELSDYELDNIVTKNLDISNRYDTADFQRTPFTIAAKRKPAPALPSQRKIPIGASPPAKKKAPRSKKRPSLTDTDHEDNIPIDEESTTHAIKNSEDSEEPKKKKPKKIPYGGWSSYAEQEEMEERAARSGGGAIIPAVLQPKPSKEDKKKKSGTWRAPASGWQNASGDAPPPSKPLPGFTTSYRNRKAIPPRPNPPSIVQTLDRLAQEEQAKKPKTTGKEGGGKEKKEPAKKGKAAAKPRGKGKKDEKNEEESITFGRLPAGAAPNDDFPILKGIEKMKNMPVKPKKIDVDKLVPLTKTKTKKDNDLNTKKKKLDNLKYDSSSKTKSTYKSEEFVDVDREDAESIEPPSDDETLHPSTDNQAKWFSKLFKDINEEEDRNYQNDAISPTINQSNPTEPTDLHLTPEDTESNQGNPSTMTHLSDQASLPFEHATSSSRLPYSSPVLGRDARASKGSGIINPIPVKDQTSQIALLQKMANRGHTTDIRGTQGYTRRFNTDEEDVRPFEEQEEWSTLNHKPSRYAQKSMSRRDDHQPIRPAPLFPQNQGSIKREEVSQLKPYGKITLFQPPSRQPQAQSSAYSIATIPNGARNIKTEYEAEEMQWKGSPRKFQEQQKPKGQPSWLRAADAARPKLGGGVGEMDDGPKDWREEWQKPKRDVSNNVLGKYALKGEVKRGEVDSMGRAFRL